MAHPHPQVRSPYRCTVRQKPRPGRPGCPRNALSSHHCLITRIYHLRMYDRKLIGLPPKWQEYLVQIPNALYKVQGRANTRHQFPSKASVLSHKASVQNTCFQPCQQARTRMQMSKHNTHTGKTACQRTHTHTHTQRAHTCSRSSLSATRRCSPSATCRSCAKRPSAAEAPGALFARASLECSASKSLAKRCATSFRLTTRGGVDATSSQSPCMRVHASAHASRFSLYCRHARIHARTHPATHQLRLPPPHPTTHLLQLLPIEQRSATLPCHPPAPPPPHPARPRTCFSFSQRSAQAPKPVASSVPGTRMRPSSGARRSTSARHATGSTCGAQGVYGAFIHDTGRSVVGSRRGVVCQWAVGGRDIGGT